MFLIRVVPLAKLPMNAPSVLDYFWPDALQIGCVVRAPMGRRTVMALVLDVHDIRSAKLAVKRAGFELKKLSDIVTDSPQLTSAQIELARWISFQYACSLATAVKTVAPASLGSSRSRIDHLFAPSKRSNAPGTNTVLLTQPDTARTFMTGIVRKARGQALILVPERSIVQALSSAIPDASCVHSGLTTTQMRSVYRGVLDGSIRTVIGTRTALFLPWTDLAQVIVEDPLNEMYKSDMTPRYNAPDVARQLASLHGAGITWLTAALSTVQHHMAQTGAISVEHRKPYWPAVTVSTAQDEAQAGHRAVFSRAAQDAILDTYERCAPLLVVSARRAYATVARCTRCFASVQCRTCGIPMRWHRTSEDLFVCYHCAAFRSVPKQCEVCHAGVLKPSGTPGSQKLAEAINVVLDRAGYQKLAIPILDSDLVRDAADAERVLAVHDASSHPMLVATSMILGRRYERSFDTVIVPYVDMLASNPDYRTQDRLILQLEKLADFRPSRMILQTFQDDGLASRAATRDWPKFFDGELAHRKALRWPPYSRIVKLSFSHHDRRTASRAAVTGADRIRRAMTYIHAPGTQILGPAPALVEHGGGRWTHHLIIKHSLLPSKITELLHYVPDGWVIDVDPRTIA